MHDIGIIANLDKPGAEKALLDLASYAAKIGVHLVSTQEVVDAAGGGPAWIVSDGIPPGISEVAVVGGDGTLLRAAHAMRKSDAALMGLNNGTLGYLTGAESSRFEEAVAALASGRYVTSERDSLFCRVTRASGDVETYDAVNDAVLARSNGKLVKIALSLDEVPVTRYICDGVIVSTPTGSTAYSLSAGGPIVMPGAKATVVTVICPHALASRPLVVPQQSDVSLVPFAPSAPLSLCIDGEDVTTVGEGDSVVVSKGEWKPRIAFLPDHDDYQRLSRKLGFHGGLA